MGNFNGIKDLDAKELQRLQDEVVQMQSQFEKNMKLERFKRLNKLVRPGQILFAGSSLMEQFPVHELLQDMGETVPYAIYNRGIGGFTTPELLNAMDICIYGLKPAYIFINIGTNDMNGPDYDRNILLGRYEQILQGIKENLPKAKVYLLAYYPVCPEVGKTVPFMAEILKYRDNRRVSEANEGIKELARKMGMEYLDLNAGLTEDDGSLKAEFTVEGMHMYGNGYKVVLENLLPVLKSL